MRGVYHLCGVVGGQQRGTWSDAQIDPRQEIHGAGDISAVGNQHICNVLTGGLHMRAMCSNNGGLYMSGVYEIWKEGVC